MAGLGYASPDNTLTDLSNKHNEAGAGAKEKEEGEKVEEEEDYMSMNFAEPAKSAPETSIQRRARKQREAELRAHKLSKAEQAAKDAADRAAALETSTLDSSNKGFQMMAKLGFKGGALGKNKDGRTEPIQLALKEDRGGIGMDSEKKRKIREQAEGMEKRVKAEEGDYRERVRREREEKRTEGLVIGAMKVAERLDEETEQDQQPGTIENDEDDEKKPARKSTKTLSSIPLVWRALVRHRREIERERRMRYDLHQSLSKNPAYLDPEEDAEDKVALAREEEELEEEDAELDEFTALEPEVRLARLVEYLRDKHWYCFWCKAKYDDASMDGCPGITEDDHD